ncbi:branched-chain amino acid ABC transporter permease [Deinococcus yavapaiensis]|uniref:Amino acid/amide ABC transporter membrane protein 1 (HAAT family) n=1 Tax=Deinococcus yavapaiensis KR-236 TaxID=694435 RepID=A0A318S164_9DEIO|nr:branched-chain amino acid ABC transporter permease [Deinococcus yavapaiensis]PYE49883.1 amino acid/amide ABC transporter membrane protein 1 (HAAT family) [Deinococcus yavapaiensis KR-236]
MDIVGPLLVQVLVTGLTLGFVYAIIALGYTMVYGVLQLINFAHSEVFVTGAVVGFEAFRILAPVALNAYLKLLIALFAAMLVAGVLNVVIERLAYRPLRGAPRLVPLITAIGVSLILQDLLKFLEGTQGRFNLVYELPTEFNSQLSLPAFVTSLGVRLSVKDILIVVIALLMLAFLNYLVNRTRVGRAIRAVAQDRTTAGLMGIDANRMIALTFLIGGALGGVGGVMFGLQFGTVNAYSGIIPGIKAFTAAVLGGIGSIPGAVLGGLVLGLLENFLGIISIFGSLFQPLSFLQAIGAEYKDIGAFLALILILMLKPQGLLGRGNTEKV